MHSAQIMIIKPGSNPRSLQFLSNECSCNFTLRLAKFNQGIKIKIAGCFILLSIWLSIWEQWLQNMVEKAKFRDLSYSSGPVADVYYDCG